MWLCCFVKTNIKTFLWWERAIHRFIYLFDKDSQAIECTVIKKSFSHQASCAVFPFAKVYRKIPIIHKPALAYICSKLRLFYWAYFRECLFLEGLCIIGGTFSRWVWLDNGNSSNTLIKTTASLRTSYFSHVYVIETPPPLPPPPPPPKKKKLGQNNRKLVQQTHK